MKGLLRDYLILRRLLTRWGHEVIAGQFNGAMVPDDKVDLNIFCETVAPAFLPLAKRNVAIPNPEWWFPQYDASLSALDFICCKTHDTLDIFSKKAGRRAVFIGFAAEDHHLPSVPRQRKFLHIAGGSQVKNTLAILEAWATGIDADLVIVGKFFPQAAHYPRVTWHESVGREQLIQLQNECLFHLMPSAYEGFGHAIHEGFGVGARVIGIDALPMTEWPLAGRVKPVAYTEIRLAKSAICSGTGVHETVSRLLRAGGPVENSRLWYELERDEFENNLRGVIAG
jgi:hypothetical protein